MIKKLQILHPRTQTKKCIVVSNQKWMLFDTRPQKDVLWKKEKRSDAASTAFIGLRLEQFLRQALYFTTLWPSLLVLALPSPWPSSWRTQCCFDGRRHHHWPSPWSLLLSSTLLHGLHGLDWWCWRCRFLGPFHDLCCFWHGALSAALTIIGLRLDRFLRQALCFIAFMAFIAGAGAAFFLAFFMAFVTLPHFWHGEAICFHCPSTRRMVKNVKGE